jgi:hypothetical protein
MVVPVLVTSCHVSENAKIGPVTAHAMTMMTARTNADGTPMTASLCFANLLNALADIVRSSVRSDGLQSMKARQNEMFCAYYTVPSGGADGSATLL